MWMISVSYTNIDTIYPVPVPTLLLVVTCGSPVNNLVSITNTAYLYTEYQLLYIFTRNNYLRK